MSTRRIDTVETLTRDPSLCRIGIGTRSLEPIRREDIDRLSIKPGTVWSSALEREVLSLMEIAQVHRAALVAMGRSAVSRERLTERLMKRGFSRSSVISALDQLHADGWLDDRAAAESRARVIAQRGRLSGAAIERQLRSEGFEEGVAARSRRVVDSDDLERASQLVAKALPLRRGVAALARRLARGGFDSEIIRKALRRHGLQFDEDVDAEVFD